MAAIAAVSAVVAGIAQHPTRARQLSPISDLSCNELGSERRWHSDCEVRPREKHSMRETSL
jgi:hypothetical protein